MPSGYFILKNSRRDSKTVTDDYIVSVKEDLGLTIDNIGSTKAVEITLPKAEVGMEISFYVGAAYKFVLKPQTTEQVSLSNGAYHTASAKVKSPTTVGASATYICREPGKWAIRYSVGTWEAN